MPVDPNPTNAFQRSMLARAHSVTREQLDVARDLLEEMGGAGTPDEQRGLVLQIVQALATNYLAETMNSKLAK